MSNKVKDYVLKSDLVVDLSRKYNLTPIEAQKIVYRILEIIKDSLVSKARVEVRNFGRFITKLHQPRRAHNPRTGERITTDSRSRPHFKPGKGMKEAVNKAFLDE